MQCAYGQMFKWLITPLSISGILLRFTFIYQLALFQNFGFEPFIAHLCTSCGFYLNLLSGGKKTNPLPKSVCDD